jgi:hypothetical protein
MSGLFVPGLMDRVFDWLASRLEPVETTTNDRAQIRFCSAPSPNAWDEEIGSAKGCNLFKAAAIY